MKCVNVQEAKTHLSKLLEQVAGGETIVIGKAGSPVATLSAWEPGSSPRKGGGWAGKAWIANDFDTPSRELEALFYGDDFAEPLLRVAEDSPA